MNSIWGKAQLSQTKTRFSAVSSKPDLPFSRVSEYSCQPEKAGMPPPGGDWFSDQLSINCPILSPDQELQVFRKRLTSQIQAAEMCFLLQVDGICLRDRLEIVIQEKLRCYSSTWREASLGRFYIWQELYTFAPCWKVQVREDPGHAGGQKSLAGLWPHAYLYLKVFLNIFAETAASNTKTPGRWRAGCHPLPASFSSPVVRSAEFICPFK